MRDEHEIILEKKTGIPPIPEAQILKLLRNAEFSTRRHSATICRFDGFIYSGVFVKSHGFEGILTAGHCASEFLAVERFALLISASHHRLTVTSSSVEHIPIGYDELERYTNDGPDLSFVILHDDNLKNLLRSHNYGFYNLDSQNMNIFWSDLAKFNWCVAGSALEKTEMQKRAVNGEEHTFVSAISASMQGNLVSFERRGDFDYVKLRLISGAFDFPKDFDGVSGGGIWYLRFVTKDNKVFSVEPILAGIAVWQSQPHNDQRTITGHGYESIYGHVRRILAEKQTRRK